MQINELLTKVAKIRRAEELLLEEFGKGGIRGTIHTSIGQEYAAVILSSNLKESIWFSNHRGHAHFLAKTENYKGFFAEILGKEGAVNSGFGGSQHLYVEHEYISNGIQGGQLGIASGLSSPYSYAKSPAVMFIGDGTLGAGHIYESLNIASMFKSRLLVVIEDNEVAQSTPSHRTFRGSVKSRIEGFGCEYLFWERSNSWLESLNTLEKTINEGIQKINSTPVVLHLKTSRLGPHSKSDDNRPLEYIKNLELNDFLNCAVREEAFLIPKGEINEVEETFTHIRSEPDLHEFRPTLSTSKKELEDLSKPNESFQLPAIRTPRDLISSSLSHALEKWDAVLFGEDIEDFPYVNGSMYGGAFKVTTGLSSKYPNQVCNMPISESGFIGFGIGCSLSGRLTIIEIMFSDFLSQCLDQIIHQLSKIPSIYGLRIDLPLILRAASGPGKGYGPTHSHTLENVLLNLPNLLVASVSPFSNYLGLLEYVENERKPLLIFEPKSVYGFEVSIAVYDQYHVEYTTDIFQPTRIFPKFNEPDLTVIALGHYTTTLLHCLKDLYLQHEISIEIFMPTVVSNLDSKSLISSARNTRKLLVLSDSLGSNGFIANWAKRERSNLEIVSIREISVTNWIPNGILESEFVLNEKRLISELVRFHGEVSE